MSETQGAIAPKSTGPNRETPARTVATRAPGWSRFFVIALALHIPFFFYPILRLCNWLDLPLWLTAVIFVPLAASQVVSRLYLRHNSSPWHRWLRLVADFWLGVSPLMLITLLIFEVIVLVDLLSMKSAAISVIAIALACGLAGMIVAMVPVVKKVRFKSASLKAPIHIVSQLQLNTSICYMG